MKVIKLNINLVICAPCIRGVDAKYVDAVQEELERIAQHGRPFDIRTHHARPHNVPSFQRRCVASGALHLLDDVDHRSNEALAADPLVGPLLCLTLDEVDVNHFVDRLRLPVTGELGNTVTDFGKHSKHAHEARRRKLHVIPQAVPERLWYNALLELRIS